MITTETAKDLVDRFLQRRYTAEDTKECALICVDAVLDYYTPTDIDFEFWYEVKKEIKKL